MARFVDEVGPDVAVVRGEPLPLDGQQAVPLQVTLLTPWRILLGKVNAATVDGREVGKVLILRDRTELLELRRELDLTRHVTDTLRAQAHEFGLFHRFALPGWLAWTLLFGIVVAQYLCGLAALTAITCGELVRQATLSNALMPSYGRLAYRCLFMVR